MLDPKLKDKLNQAYSKIGEIGYQSALSLRKGKDFTTKQRELWEKGIKIWTILKILFRHVDLETTPPTLYNITEKQVNELVRCLEKLGQLDALPIVPKIFPGCKPNTINTGGGSGTTGPAGPAGSDANIVVQLQPGETELELAQTTVGGVKTYTLGFTLYKAPDVSISFADPQIHEKGTVVSTKNVTLTSDKGSESVTAMTIFDSTLNALLQSIINLTTINGNIQPVINVLPVPDVSDSLLVQVTITDGINPFTISKTLPFVYPILHGNNDNTSITYYTSLTKLIEEKGTKNISFNGDYKYFFVCYPASYGDIKIYDHNEIEVTSEFTITTTDITSTGLTNNWTTSYKIYRTTDKTTINNRLFRIEFTS